MPGAEVALQVDAGEASVSLFGAMLRSLRNEMRELGMQLLREVADEMRSASHGGFQPMRAAGYPRAMQIRGHYMNNAPLSWRSRCLHINTVLIPRKGLVHKVLRGTG